MINSHEQSSEVESIMRDGPGILHNKEVILADANLYLRRITRSVLLNLGAKAVVEFDNGLAVFDAVQAGEPHLLVIDWNVPLLNAAELLNLISHNRGSHQYRIPSIITINEASPRNIKDCIAVGADQITLKPISPNRLSEHIVRAFAAHAQRCSPNVVRSQLTTSGSITVSP